MLRRAQIFVATGFYSGYAPLAPGTVGTVVAAACLLPFGAALTHRPLAFGVFLVALSVIAIWASSGAEHSFGNHDSGKIVIDEFLGYYVALWGIHYSWSVALAAFGAFRLFDILKPPPVNWVDQKLGGGPGVVLDDVVAGIYANVLLRVVIAQGWIS